MGLIDRLSDRLGWAAAWLFFVTGVFLTYEVAARYLFNAPTTWAAELSQLLLIWGVFLALARTLHRRENIAIDFLYDRLPNAGRRALDVFTLVVVAAFSAAVAWYGGDIALDSYLRGRSTGTMLNIPNWWSEFSVPVGFGMLLVQSLIELRRVLRGEAWASSKNSAGE